MNPNQTNTPVAKKEDTHSYKGWLNSDKFLKRTFAVWGYYLVANLIVTAAVLIPLMIIGGIVIAVAAN